MELKGGEVEGRATSRLVSEGTCYYTESVELKSVRLRRGRLPPEIAANTAN